MKNIKKGFTLIELLVVIAIIGILASVVLASLNTARSKANNAAVKSQLSSVRAEMEILFDPGQTYVGGCASANVVRLLDAASTQGAGNATSDVCNETATAWAASAPLRVAESGNGFWCVDSLGTSKSEVAALGAGVTACP